MQTTCPPDIALQIERAAQSYSNGKREAKGWLAVLCPYGHVHDKPGEHAWLSPENNFIFCHGKHQDIHWRDICQAWGITVPDSCERLSERPIERLERPSNSQVKGEVYFNPDWIDFLQLHSPTIDFLAERGINPYWALQYGLGYTSHDERLPRWAHEKLAIPWLANGEVAGVKLRCIGKPKGDKGSYVSLPNSDFSGLFNLVLPDDMYIAGATSPYHVIVETELDALAFSIALGYPHAVLAIPASSVTPDKLLALMGKPLYICPDNDEAGQAMVERIKAIRPDCQTLAIPTGYKDFGAYQQHELNAPDWFYPLLNKEAYQHIWRYTNTQWNSFNLVKIEGM